MNFSKKKNTALNLIKKRKIKILLKEQKNKECFECSRLNPEYISLNNGIFLCHICVKRHLKYPKIISNIIKNNLNNLTLKNIQYLCCGGNQKLNEFINTEYPNLKNFAPEYLYQTYAMDYYRKSLEYLIEGGIKPNKPDKDKAYEFIIKNNGDDLPKKRRNLNKIKSESLSKMFRKKYPKIKPIVGSKNSFRFTHSLSRYNKSLDLSIIGNNYNNSLDLENLNSTNFHNSNHKVNNLTKKLFFYQLSDDLNNDTNNDDINNMTDINEITQFNNEENDNKNENINSTNSYKKKIFLDTNIKVFKANNLAENIKTCKIYSKPVYQICLNSSNQENYLYKKNKNKNENIQKSHKAMNSIDNVRNYLSIKRRKNKNYLIDLKKHNSNTFVDEPKYNINNFNNNIIINKSLNIFYNNNSLSRIFKKKTIGNSFSINDNIKQKKINSINNSIDRHAFFMNRTMGNENKKFYIKKNKCKNDIKKKLLDNPDGNSSNTFIEKIKVNRQFKPDKKINNINNIITEKNKYDNEFLNSEDQKSKIIQRISRVLKKHKEKEKEKMKSIEEIKVNQNIKNNNLILDDKTPKAINKTINEKAPKTEISDEFKKKYTLSIKELINVPFLSKKKNIIDIIKTNNLYDKLISPNTKKALQINTEPKRYQKKDLLSKSQQTKYIKSKLDKDKDKV
jgi:hypothetical protein